MKTTFKLPRIAQYLRPIVQLMCFTVVVALFLNIGESALLITANDLALADPIIAVSSILYYQGAWVPALLSAGILIVGSFLLGRAFCGWICPVGFLIDISGFGSKLFSKLIRRKPGVRRFGYLQYGILAVVILLSLVTIQALAILDPFVVLRRSIFVLENGGIPYLLLAILLISVLLAPRFWCRAICPAGAIIGLAAIPSPFKFRRAENCAKCTKCSKVCSMGAISKDLKWDATACIKCLECESGCPKGSVSFALPKMPGRDPLAVSESRRAFMIAGGLFGLFALSKGTAVGMSDDSPSSAKSKPLIRPPGSLEEGNFNAACVRCGSCAKVCPTRVIKLIGLDRGLEKVYTPALNYCESYCSRCGDCGDVCPTGAIIRVPEEQMRVGTAEIDQCTCLAWHETRCLLCKKACIYNAITSEGDFEPRVDKAKCKGCGRCELVCPVKNKAIVVTNAGEIRREV